MPSVTCLLISGDPSLADAVGKAIGPIDDLRLEVVSALDPENIHLYRSDLGLVILHLGRRKSDGDAVTRILETGRFQRRHVAVIVVADQPDPELALALTRQGTAEFMARPLDLRRLAYLADSLTIRARQSAGVGVARQTTGVASLGETEPFLFAPGTQMGNVMEKVLRVAPQDTTILLTGETGTGKSRLARLIHELSPRKQQPFHVINCGALSANLLESEMFGHVKGAFTGADRDRTGKCADVGRGTLVLDEVDTLSLDMQVKLLRVVEDRVFEPVGSNRSQPLQARLVVATNRDLREEIASKRFRADLYYRLNVVEFGLLSLRERMRERPEVILSLAENFLLAYAEKQGRTFCGFTPDAVQAMQSYSWPGNVREVRNVIERAVALGNGPYIAMEDLPAELTRAPAYDDTLENTITTSADATLAQTKEEAEMARIVQALAKHPGNRQRAAMELGISRMTLYNKLRRYGI
jgi:DNA-binding NtrC family response regulator